MWKRLGRRDDDDDDEEEEEEKLPLPDLNPGMLLEVLTMQNRLIFRGRIEEVRSEDSIHVVDADGGDLPYVEYNTRVKLQGYMGATAISMVGMIGGSNSRLWKIDRLGTLQTSNRRNFFRQFVSLEAIVVKLEEAEDQENQEDQDGQDAQKDGQKKLQPGRRFRARMLDISAGGAMLYADEILKNGDRVRIEHVILMDGEAPFDFEGVIRRAIKREDRWEYGVEFEDLDSKQQERLIRIILLLQRNELRARRGR